LPTKYLTSFQLNDIWDFHVDNSFATSILDKIGPSAFGSIATSPNKRCAKCEALEFSTPHFSIIDRWEDLEDCLPTCDFCKARWEICSQLDRGKFSIIAFERDQSMLKLSGMNQPVLSIRQGPGESLDSVERNGNLIETDL
jgi:hypothetical protein